MPRPAAWAFTLLPRLLRFLAPAPHAPFFQAEQFGNFFRALPLFEQLQPAFTPSSQLFIGPIGSHALIITQLLPFRTLIIENSVGAEKTWLGDNRMQSNGKSEQTLRAGKNQNASRRVLYETVIILVLTLAA